MRPTITNNQISPRIPFLKNRTYGKFYFSSYLPFITIGCIGIIRRRHFSSLLLFDYDRAIPYHENKIVKQYCFTQLSLDFFSVINNFMWPQIFSVQIHTPSRNTSSTAYYSPKDNSGNLKCRICENVYTHPIILPCQHTFCFGCIAAICR